MGIKKPPKKVNYFDKQKLKKEAICVFRQLKLRKY